MQKTCTILQKPTVYEIADMNPAAETAGLLWEFSVVEL
jgi:hypothetical protein